MKPAASATALNPTVPASLAGIHEIEEVPSPHASPSHSPTQPDGALTMLSRRPSKRGKETAEVTAPASQSASHLQSVGLQVSQPAMSPDPGRASLMRLKEQLAADKLRPVEPQLAAALINKMRPMKLPDASGPQARAATHADLLGRIRETDAMAWYRAQGLSESEVSNLRRTALLSGMPNPTGSFLNNAMQYIVSPWISYATRQPWAGAGFGFATAAIAAPMNAAQQSAVVSLCESIREHGGHVIVPDKNQINDKHWLPDLAKALESHIQEFSGCCDRFRALKAAAGQSPAATATADLTDAAHQLLQAEARLHQAQHDFVMTQGAHDRQWKGNRWQAIPRILRSPVAGTLGLLSKTGAMRALSPTAQTVGALLMTAAQHVAAGFDEQAKQDYNNKLNLLYADVLTETGKSKLARGEPVAAEEIDQSKLRGLIQSPTQALVKRVITGLVSLEKALKAELAASPSPQGTPDTDDLDLESGHGAGPAKALKLLSQDLQSLRDGRLDELDPDGVAATLLLGAEKSVVSDQLIGDIVKKYTSREFSAQTAQRIGQMFHLGVLGSAASSVIGKASSAAQGGTRNVPTAQTLAISALSGAMAAVGALNQHTAITVKNNRREGGTDIGLKQQVIRGVMGGANEALSQRRATKASRAINALLQHNDVEDLLGQARALVQQSGATSSAAQAAATLTLPQAVEQLRPGMPPTSQSHEVSVQIGDE
ncbi:type III secretion system effector protein [Xanthomonas nasturtii]|uniref:Type III secretion system effector protein n=1 Tax=Xanthomonas nasturtii TaxID=1843581 RepID=A0A3E1KQ93_9XANT|nr:type III secretion system effector XopN [Xanthomonas nasturtii]MCL1528908.1 type III secretion system effector protein [Xanthomonas nasturtii]MCL1564044.1 type III secretion system effector protein [Xanthomonas nasturtii]MCL1568059.1 type III secretion system effector protein [Xanthomonas nasturtii]MCL1571885.1 type III secretion system effector protein [Xanthomonas nasturtii]MCL1579306.1 type III secretion system effector protein [Xanthomonas nasturtii]